jgi:hypothetical protein
LTTYRFWTNGSGDYFSDAASYQRGFLDGQRSVVNFRLSEEFLEKLIMLCHPDKHDNSKMSNEVTQSLLKAREALCGKR